MKLTIVLLVTVLATLAKARDLSQYTPKNIFVHPTGPGTFNPKIVGGAEAEPHSYPHSVAVYIDGRSFCGGSVIREDVVLTAAHCAEGAKTIEVVAGAHNVNNNEPSQQSIESSKFIIHEDWDRNSLTNDLALIILPKALTLNDYVKPITLNTGACVTSNLDGTPGTVSGWGRPSDSTGSISPVLRHVTDDLLSNEDCRKSFNIIKDTHICLNGKNGRGSCNGDSGGALLGNVNGNRVQVGIVSFGSGWGCEWGFPTGYTRVSCFDKWVESNLP